MLKLSFQYRLRYLQRVFRCCQVFQRTFSKIFYPADCTSWIAHSYRWNKLRICNFVCSKETPQIKCVDRFIDEVRHVPIGNIAFNAAKPCCPICPHVYWASVERREEFSMGPAAGLGEVKFRHTLVDSNFAWFHFARFVVIPITCFHRWISTTAMMF